VGFKVNKKSGCPLVRIKHDDDASIDIGQDSRDIGRDRKSTFTRILTTRPDEPRGHPFDPARPASPTPRGFRQSMFEACAKVFIV
jgi:hypothetical protein